MSQKSPNLPRKQPRQGRARETVDAIVTATERVVARAGPQKATTNEIARVAGVSIGSLYQYFPNKESLVETVRDKRGQAFDERLAPQIERIARLPLRDAVRGIVDVLVVSHLEALELHNALDQGDELHQHLEERWLPVMVEVFERRRNELRPDDLEIAARIALESIENLIHGAALRAPERLRDAVYLEEITELIHRYLAA